MKLTRTLIYSSFFIFYFSFCIVQKAYSQASTDEQLAFQYYQDKQYDKAIVYYQKLFSKNPSPDNYHYYVECLNKAKDYKTAEKVIKKEMKQQPDNNILYVDLGTLYKLESEDKQAKESFNKAIQKLKPDKDKILDLGTAFIDAKQWDYALETFKQGKALLNDTYPFIVEIGAVYKSMGNTAGMIDSYLETLAVTPSYIQNVQDALALSVGNYVDAEQNAIVKNELLKYIQRYPDKDVFPELYVWMMLQLHKYAEALVQVKALDRRNHEGGAKVMSLAHTCVDVGEYDAAIQAYQYVIDLGANTKQSLAGTEDNYSQAKMEQLNAMYQKLISGGIYTQQDILNLQEKYKQTLAALPQTPGTVALMLDLAHIDGFYLHNDTEAVALMHEAIAIPGVQSLTQARCRMELADILLVSGKTWEASLLYGKIENDFKEEPIGDEAKFKNAEIYYYTGNFKWAGAELDILKSATTKLIANDAMALSLVVADNIQDSSKVPALTLFAHVQLLDFQNYDDSASILLDSVFNISGTTTLKEEVLMMRAHIAEKKGKFEDAVNYYTEETKTFNDGMLPDKALYYLARLEDYKLHDQKKAADYYKELILHYPGSFYIDETRDRYRQLVKDDTPPSLITN